MVTGASAAVAPQVVEVLSPAIRGKAPVRTAPAQVAIRQQLDGSWQYLVDGQPEWPIGIGYNPVYRYLSVEERRANYERDFKMFRDSGITLLVMWTAEKGSIQ